MNNYIKINHLTSIDLYNNLNLIVPLNKFITITGPNNSGKSTLLKLLNKDIDIENTIFINNKDISKYTYKEQYKLTKLISVDNLLFNKSNILDEIKFYLLRNNNYTKDNLDYYLKQFKLNSILKIKVVIISFFFIFFSLFYNFNISNKSTINKS